LNHPSADDIPPNIRLISAGMGAAAVIGLLVNHWMAQSQNVVGLMILCLGPMAAFLGLGGAIEPRIVLSVGKYGQHLPLKYKIMGGALAGLGLIVTLILVFGVYSLGRPM